MEGFSSMLPLLLLFLVMYLFLIRPQMQKAKKEKKFAAELTKGTRIVTIGGIHGKLIDVFDDGTCLVDIGAGRVKLEKAAISMDKTNQLNETEKK